VTISNAHVNEKTAGKTTKTVTGKRRLSAWVAVALVVAGVASYSAWRTRRITSLSGAVLRQDNNPGKQLPIANAEVTVSDGATAGSTISDSNGLFQLKLRERVHKGEQVILHLRHAEYLPLDLPEIAADRLFIVRMTPVVKSPAGVPAPVTITDVRVRYSMKDYTTQNVGSVAKTFEVANKGDVPCDRRGLCSPDGKWNAAVGGASLDAGEGNEFQHARVTCLGGPCPFTRVDKDAFSGGGRQISVSVRNWSDPTSFVLEAEVVHATNVDVTRHSFPVILDQAMSFSLPASAQGPSIEATLDHQDIVFPLGPALKLSWANCTVQVGKDLTKLYRCVLKPGYRF
jgi:hypothetical protein